MTKRVEFNVHIELPVLVVLLTFILKKVCDHV